MFSMAFMQRALMAGLIVAIISPVIGLHLVLRRLSMYGDALAHVSLAGVAVGVLAGLYPGATGLIFAVVASLGLEWLRRSYGKYSELSVAVTLAASMALAAVLLSMAPVSGANVMGYLFGSISLVGVNDLYLVGGLGAVVVLVMLLLSKEMLSVSFDEEFARISGLPLAFINTLFIVLTAMTVGVTMRVVGVLLVSALMVVPVAVALQVARSFRSALVSAIAVGIVSVVLGLAFSYQWNLAPGGTVVLTAVAMLLLVIGYKRLRGLE